MITNYHKTPEKNHLDNNPLIAPFFYDIDKEIASRAFYHTSHSPEVRGASMRALYSNTLLNDKNEVIKYVDKAQNNGAEVLPDHLIIIENWFIGYRNSLKAKYIDYLYAHAQVASSFITGSANFPVARNAKKITSADNKQNAIDEYRIKAKKYILKTLLPFGDGSSINGCDPKAKEKLQIKINALEKQREQMKKANTIVRRYFKKGVVTIPLEKRDQCESELRKNTTFDLAIIVTLLKPNYMNNVIPFETYQLASVGAEIKRLNQRITEIKQTQSVTIDDRFENGINVEISEDQKICIHFNFKPNEDVRSVLKRCAFKWSRFRKAWVRKLTLNASADYKDRIKPLLIGL